MQYLTIASSTKVPGRIISRASVPRVSLSRDYPLAASDPVVMAAYRASVVERHLLEHLQLAPDGSYFSPRCLNLWELIGQTVVSEYYIPGEEILAVINHIGRLLKQDTREPISAAFIKRETLVGLSVSQRAAVHVALSTSVLTLSELTTEEKRMTWFGHPRWCAEDCTIAAELLTELTARRAKLMQFL